MGWEYVLNLRAGSMSWIYGLGVCPEFRYNYYYYYYFNCLSWLDNRCGLRPSPRPSPITLILDTPHWVGILWKSDRPVAVPDNNQHSQETDFHVPSGIRTRNPSVQATPDPRLRPRGHWDRHTFVIVTTIIIKTIIFINCNWVVTRWQWLFYLYTKHEIGYYWI